MSFFDSSDALYGTGRHGSARYGRVTPNVALSGVSATGAIETVSVGGFVGGVHYQCSLRVRDLAVIVFRLAPPDPF